ncbi:MAG: ATP-binding cassette domain-containing protein [Thiohalomonadales bacterium]
MLKFTHLSLRRGKRELLHDVNLTIHAGQRVGLTGANGVGKSSLFSLLRSELQPDTGDFSLPSATVIAHVAQETPALDRPALQYVIDGDAQLRQLEARIESSQSEGQGEIVAHCYAEIESIHGYSAPSRASKLLHGLGFDTAQEQQSVREFSGGWRMRLNLAQALMCRSDLLLLDEPTNHLDLDTVLWLEDWLRNYTGTLLLISHDRDFLDQVTTHIAHIEQSQLSLYTGNYSAFEIRRAEQLANQQSAFEKQQREIAHMQSFVDRFRAKATKARQAQSRVKALERMTLISQAHIDSPFHFSFTNAERMPNQLLNIERVTVGYSEKIVLHNVDMGIMAGDRIGLLGHNGAGKSTLIKLIANSLAPKAGELHFAKDINIGYFAQHQLEQLDGDASPLLHLQRLDKNATEKRLRSFLGGFAFSNDMATSPVAPFSGGEKARLVLAMIVYQRPNLLLLDEPTNHLDLEMRHSLTVALQEFEGAMVIVSHDRHLLRTVTDRLLLVADGVVNEFDGDLDDYRLWVKQQFDGQESRHKSSQPTIQQGTAMGNKKARRQQSAESRRELKNIRNKLKNMEKNLDQLNQEKQSLQERLAVSDMYSKDNKVTLGECQSRQRQVIDEIEAVELDWFELSEILQEIE